MAAILNLEVMAKAECVIVFSSVLKAAFVVDASYGLDAMVCRTAAVIWLGCSTRIRRETNREKNPQESKSRNTNRIEVRETL